ncbi:MAG: hypothetical protein IMZ57_03945 [Acidobacteria bacterium]|nr:hypothetical protein [Acidobacteriota bacterium]
MIKKPAGFGVMLLALFVALSLLSVPGARAAEKSIAVMKFTATAGGVSAASAEVLEGKGFKTGDIVKSGGDY